MQDLSFRTLLYRYFFFAWLYKDASQGTMFERAAALRYNKAHAHWLLTYMRRWLWCGLLLAGLGAWMELVLNSALLSAFFYVPGALSVPINATIAAAWLGLKVFPPSF